jgi:S-formylglutathione hydrolase FrmB
MDALTPCGSLNTLTEAGRQAEPDTAASAAPPTHERQPRLVTITIPSHGMVTSRWLSHAGQPRADVLLPAGYTRSKAYPLLLLLHGASSPYTWYVQAGLTSVFDHLKAIVVMPPGGTGWYTNWWNDGERAHPAWENYELDEVIPAVLTHYRILPQRRDHAIAGISMGGLGAAFLGGRLPGFFGSVAILSGYVDPQLQPGLVDAMGILSLAAQKGDNDPDPVDGPATGFYADGHNPTRLAMNLKQTRVFESTGTGVLSSADKAAGVIPTRTVGLAEEGRIIYPMSEALHRALIAAGVDVTYQVHSGGHLVPDFRGELEALLAWGLFKPVMTHPTSWTNDTVASSGQLWSASYRFARPPDHVVRFRQSGNSLSISAAGSPVTVTDGHCTVHTETPVEIHVRACRTVVEASGSR